jgi:hypothetical protein
MVKPQLAHFAIERSDTSKLMLELNQSYHLEAVG